MKKFFTLVAAVAAAVCANAADLTFDFAVSGNTLTVTPSDNETEYYYYAVPANVMAMWNGFIMPGCASDPDRLFSVTVGMCDTPFTGVATEQLAEGEYTVVAAPVTVDGTNWKAAGAASMKQLTVGGETVDPTPGEEPGNVDFDVTFTLDSDGASFTINPSNDEATYYFWVFSEEDKAEAEEQGMTLEEAIPLYAAYAMEDEIHQGACTDTADNWYLDEEGKYYVAIIPVRYDAEQDIYVAAGQAAVLEWDYTTSHDDPTAIRQLQGALVAPKAMQAGRVVLMGRYNLNGTLAR